MNRFLSLNERVLLLIRQENEASKRLFLYDALAMVMTSADDSRTPTNTPERPGPCDTPEAARAGRASCARVGRHVCHVETPLSAGLWQRILLTPPPPEGASLCAGA